MKITQSFRGFSVLFFLLNLLFTTPSFADSSYLDEKLNDLNSGILTISSFSDNLIDGVDLDEISIADIRPSKFKGIYNFDKIFGKKIKSKVYNLLIDFEFESAEKLEKLSNKLLESYNKDRKSLTRLIALSSRTKEVLSKTDIKDFDSYSLTINDPIENKLFKNISSKEILPIYQKSYTQKQYAQALRWLGRIDSNFRPDGWQGSVFQSINSISNTVSSKGSFDNLINNWPFDDEGVRKLIKDIGKNDEVSKSLGTIFSWQVRENLKANKIDRARSYYEKVLTFRADPHPENKKLRSDILSLANSPEGVDFALGRIEEMKNLGEDGLSTKMFLMKQGKNKDLSWLIYIPIVLILLLIPIIIFKLLSNLKSSKSYSQQAASSVDQKSAPSKPSVASRLSATSGGIKGATSRQQVVENPNSGKKDKGYKSSVSRDDEYSLLLAEFGLDDSAGPDEIKKAYRQKIKEYHPDVTKLSQDEANEKMNEIKQIHNRLLKFQGSLFSSNK